MDIKDCHWVFLFYREHRPLSSIPKKVIEDMMKGIMDEERKKCPADPCSQQDQNE